MKNISKTITDKKNILLLLFFIFLFSITLLIIHSPFDNSTWFPKETEGTLLYFIYLSIPIFIGIFVLTISKYIMYFYHKKREISYTQFIIWCLAEVILMAVIYSTVVLFLFNDSRDFIDIFGRSFFYILLMMLIPYIITFLYLSLLEKRAIIDVLQEKNKYGVNTEIINFSDDRKVTRFSVKIDNIYYLEAAGNYIIIHYLIKEQMEEFLLKNSINNIEKTFKEKGLIRCHRSYIVNINKVEIIKKDNKKNPVIEFDNKNFKEIPISQSYIDNIVKLFSE